jgi:hypothetical protein
MNCYVWDLKLSLIVMQVFRRREELSGYLDKWDFTEILIKIKNINHYYMIFVMYMNVLNNELNLTMRFKCQYGLLILNVEKKIFILFSWVKGLRYLYNAKIFFLGVIIQVHAHVMYFFLPQVSSFNIKFLLYFFLIFIIQYLVGFELVFILFLSYN